MLWQKRSKWILDYLFIPLLIFWCAFEPNFLHGTVDYLDEGQYLSVINEVFHGKMPIKDTFTFFGPLHIYLPVLAMRLLGKHLGILRAYFHFGSIFSLIIAYLVARSICRGRFFSYLAVFLLLLEVHHPFWSTRWGGIRMGLGLLVLLFLVAFIKRRNKICLLWAGIFSAFSIMYSPEIGIFSSISSITAIIFVCLSQKDNRIFRAIKTFLIYLVGNLLIILPFLAYLSVKNTLRSYLTASLEIIYKYHHIKAWAHPIPNFLFSNLVSPNFLSRLFSVHFKIFMPILVYTASILYIFFKLIKKVKTDTLIIICVITIYGLLLYISSFRAILGTQFQAALAGVIILECFLLENLFLYCKRNFYAGSMTSVKNKIIFIFFLCILSFSFIYLLFSEKKYYSSLKGWFYCQMNKRKLIPAYTMPVPISRVHLVPLEIERAKGILVPHYQKEDIDGVTKYILQNTKSYEPLFTFPEHGIFNFFADRPAAGRFPIACFAWANEEYRAEILRSINETRPRYILLGKGLSHLAISIGRKEELFPEISGFIKKNYTLDRTFNTVDIYHLR